jgi:hypothetical protein
MFNCFWLFVIGALCATNIYLCIIHGKYHGWFQKLLVSNDVNNVLRGEYLKIYSNLSTAVVTYSVLNVVLTIIVYKSKNVTYR